MTYIVDDRENGRFRVNREVFTDAEIYRAEREKIFERCWLYLGHTSEVSKPGSYISREVAGKPLVMTRDKGGQLHVFYNTCTHRGALVCRERSGSQPTFLCPYHAWSFDLQGKLVKMPGPEAMSPACNADGSLDLRPVERMEEFKGFVFICFDPGVMPLVDYLGDAADYLAYVADQGPEGMEIVGGTQEYAADANWKLLQENSVDGYHGAPTHVTYLEYLRSRDGAEGVANMKPGQGFGWVKNLGNGHAVSESIGTIPWGRPYARWVPGWGEEARVEVEALQAEIMERLGPERGEVVSQGDRNMIIFPNLVVNDIMAVTVRTFHSPEPGKMVINSWALAPVGESPTSRERRLRNFLEFLGPAGFATPDDVEMLELAQKGYRNGGWNDCSRGMLSDTKTKTDELQLRTFWRRWNQLMTGGAEGELVGP